MPKKSSPEHPPAQVYDLRRSRTQSIDQLKARKPQVPLPHTWRATTGADVPALVRMAETHFQTEIDTVFTPDPVVYARNLMLATVQQFYNSRAELLQVAKEHKTDRILAYTWAIRGERSPWSDEEMICAKMAHVDLSLPVRQRLRLVTGMIVLWETWARECSVPVVCSTTMRRDQEGFLNMHRRLGYDVRGSYAYKRLV